MTMKHNEKPMMDETGLITDPQDLRYLAHELTRILTLVLTAPTPIGLTVADLLDMMSPGRSQEVLGIIVNAHAAVCTEFDREAAMRGEFIKVDENGNPEQPEGDGLDIIARLLGGEMPGLN